MISYLYNYYFYLTLSYFQIKTSFVTLLIVIPQIFTIIYLL